MKKLLILLLLIPMVSFSDNKADKENDKEIIENLRIQLKGILAKPDSHEKIFDINRVTTFLIQELYRQGYTDKADDLLDGYSEFWTNYYITLQTNRPPKLPLCIPMD